MPLSETSALRLLAHAHRVQTRYQDTGGRWQDAEPQPLLAVLQALGAPLLKGMSEVRAALRARQRDRWRRMVAPVIVAWSGEPSTVPLHRVAGATAWVDCTLEFEAGDSTSWRVRWDDLALMRSVNRDGGPLEVRAAALPPGLPDGYHRLRIKTGSVAEEALVIAAPPRAWFPDARPRPSWGVFLPLYALRRAGGFGTGDFGGLRRLVEWTGSLGGRAVGTLPLTAAFLDEPIEPSPYAPASRQFWNELYLDIEVIPEMAASPPAQEIFASPAFREERDGLERSTLVDYAASMALKRRVLEPLAASMATGTAARRAAFERYRENTPGLVDYAHFRAVTEQRRRPWPDWPEPLRSGQIQGQDGAATSRHYHEYVQWLCHEQLGGVAALAAQRGVQLYLDLPLGVHYNSYDVWKERETFALDAAGGAPPDALFAGGQDWGFPPLHPEQSRSQGHRYYIAALRNYMRYAHILRIDHVMGMHRLYWVPHGFSAKQGVYVHYPAEELYAIVCLESHRNRCWVVGENLGTVPSYVNAALRTRGLHSMYVGQLSLTADPLQPLTPPPDGSLASMNTHDTPTFAGYSAGRDFEDLIDLGLLERAEAERQMEWRREALGALAGYCRRHGWVGQDPPAPEELLTACLKYLGRSQAELVLVNLEDLWGGPAPQNVPGTWRERPNWRRRARLTLEEFTGSPEVRNALQGILVSGG